MAKYSEKAGKKIGKVMKEMEAGKLKTSSGEKVTDRKQAIAIGISEARAEGYKVPPKKAATKKSASKKAATAKKTVSKKAATKKTAPKKKAAAKKRS